MPRRDDATGARHEADAGPDWLGHLRTGVVMLGARSDEGDGPPGVDWANAAAEDILAVSWRHGDGARQLARRIEASGIAELVARASAARRPVAAQDIEWSRPADNVWLDVDVSPLPDGRLLLEIGDASLRRRAAGDRERSMRRLLSRRVVRQLAHEIRNPLGGLRGAAQLLDGAAGDDERQELIAIIVREADRLAGLVDKLLQPGRRAKFAPVSIHQPLEQAAALLQAETGARLQVLRDYDPSLPDLALDVDSMVRVFVNLARNAFQAGASSVTLRTRARPRATLEGRVHRLAVETAVIDDGPGVPEALLDTLFFPLVTGRSDGHGLGLAIVQELIDRHGGQVECDSRPGRTVFRILLPVAS